MGQESNPALWGFFFVLKLVIQIWPKAKCPWQCQLCMRVSARLICPWQCALHSRGSATVVWVLEDVKMAVIAGNVFWPFGLYFFFLTHQHWTHF
jgi:hypothetical protein